MQFSTFLERKGGLFLAHAIGIFLPLSPLLLGFRLLAEPDSIGLHYPFFRFLFTEKALWLWNPLNFHGFPSALGESTATSPLPLLLSIFLYPIPSLHWSIWLSMTAAAYVFSRVLQENGISALGSWFGGTAFIASIWWTVPYFGGMSTALSIALMLFSMQVSSRHPRQSFLISLLTLTHAWYAVHWVHLPFLWVSGALLTGFLAWQGRDVGRRALALFITWQNVREGKKHSATPLLILLSTFFLSIVLALPKILPGLLYASLSFRGGGLQWEGLTLGGITLFTPVKFLFPFLELPLLNLGQAPVFFGIFGVFFAVLALSLKSLPVRLLALSYLFCFLLALEHSPLLWLLHGIPPFSYIRREGLWLALGSPAAAALSAIGFDLFHRGGAEKMRRILSSIALGIAAVVLSVSLFVSLVLNVFRENVLTLLQGIFDKFFLSQTSGLPREHYVSVIKDYVEQIEVHLSLGNPRTLFPLLTLALLGFILLRRRSLRAPLSPTLAAALGVGTTLLVLAVYHGTIPSIALPLETPVTKVLSSSSPTVYSLLPNLGKYLLYDPLDSRTEQTIAFQMTMLAPNRNLWYGIPSIDSFDNFMSRRMGKLLAWVGSESTQASGDIALAKQPLLPEEKIEEILKRKDILDLLNTKTLLSLWPLEHPELTLREEVAITEHRLPLYIYENETARPFAYFADDVVIMSPDEEKAFEILRRMEWPNTRTLIECTHCAPSSVSGQGSITVIEQQPTAITLQTQSDATEWLIVSVNNLPGWDVSIDNERVQPSLAATTFFAIPIDMGTHTVQMRFSLRTLFRASVEWALPALFPQQTHAAEAD